MCWVKGYTFLRFWIIIATFPSRKLTHFILANNLGILIFPPLQQQWTFFLNEKLFLLICEKCSLRWVFRSQWKTFYNLSWGYSGICNWYVSLTSKIILHIRMSHKKVPIIDNFWSYKTVSFKSFNLIKFFFNLINLFVNWGRSLRLRTGQTANAF